MKNSALCQQIATILDDKKAVNLLALQVDHLTVLCDYMVIATGRSTTQVSALADLLEKAMAEQGLRPSRVEGLNDARWVVMDYGSVIVHIFHPEDRAYYNLERLWDDGTNHVVLPFETEAPACPTV